MEPAPEVVAAWARLLRAQAVALGRVEAALRAAELPPLSWYDVLLELERAGGELPLRRLQDHLLLAQYNLSRLVDRMAAEGLVERTPDPTDGRARRVRITASGKRLRRRMWPVYAHAMQQSVGARLSPDDARNLADLLAKLA